MAVQGRSLDEFQIHRIVSLLARTDMSLADIAQRMGCSHAVVSSINRRYQVREYDGHRTRWILNATEGSLERAS